MALFKQRKRMPQTQTYRQKQATPGVRPQHGSRVATVALWSGGAVVALGLILVLTASLWLPATRSVVPDRYIMAYAPERVQDMIFDIDVKEQVPTPSVRSEGADSLLAAVPFPVTPTGRPQTAQPAVQAEVPVSGYVQPTRVPVEATPTATPARAAALDASAVDRERQADLSRADALLEGFTFVQQTGVNNCGPASIATMMSYWGYTFTLEEARQVLKPTPEDPNVRPDEMARFVEPLGYQMLIRNNGSFDLLKKFILAGYPVMIESGYDPEPETIGWTSHFLTLVGYSEADRGFIAMDTYRRPNWFYPYEELDSFWRQFNRRYLVAYRPDQAAAVASIVGEDMDASVNHSNALATAQRELTLDRNDPYGWFNLGTSLAGLERYEEAAAAFDRARELGLPWRFLWYQFAPFEAYLSVERYDDVVELADSVLDKMPTEEAYYYKGLALAAQGDTGRARRALEQAVRFNRYDEAAQRALAALEKGS